MMELMVVVVIVAVLAALLLPALVRDRMKAQRINCVSNLKQIGLSIRLWEGSGDQFPMKVYTNEIGGPKFGDATNAFRYFQVMSNELNTPYVLVCPADVERRPATNFTSDLNNSHLSYFIALDADETQPEMLLAGDRNVTNGAPVTNGILTLTTNQPAGWTMAMHRGNGNFAFTDGRVQQAGDSRLREAVAESGTNVNRLLFP
jgi:prepilin-type processing-associated H-X9-DG protein